MRFDSSAIPRHSTDIRLDAVHRTISKSYQGQEQSRWRHAGDGPSLITTQRAVSVDVSAR